MDIDIEKIQLIVYDFDGVLTDNKVLVFEDGREAVFCNRADGLAIDVIRKKGIPQVILSTEKNVVVKTRANKLNLEVIHGVDDKKSVLIEYCNRGGYDLECVVYIGNDRNDLEAMSLVGHRVTPSDANEKVKAIATVILETKGGDGVVKDFLENVLGF